MVLMLFFLVELIMDITSILTYWDCSVFPRITLINIIADLLFTISNVLFWYKIVNKKSNISSRLLIAQGVIASLLKVFYCFTLNNQEDKLFNDCYMNFSDSYWIIIFSFISFLAILNYLLIQLRTVKNEK